MTTSRELLPGDWRNKPGVRPVHLYIDKEAACGARVPFSATGPVKQPIETLRYCYDCLASGAGTQGASHRARCGNYRDGW